MRILLIGGLGFLGRAIGERLNSLGFEVFFVSRQKVVLKPPSYPFSLIHWDGIHLPERALEKADGIINLAGAGIMDRYWSAAYRRELLSSRLLPTKALAEAISRSFIKPKVVIQASAVGYYGMDLPETASCSELSALGKDFLADLCGKWELEALEIATQTRLCFMRLGVVLGKEGGALQKIKSLYVNGFGGILGHGNQWINWIHLEDVLQFAEKALTDSSYQGVYNLVASENATNKDLHLALCKHTPSFSFVRIPAFIVQASLGNRSALLLNGPKVVPDALLKSSFSFKFSNLEKAVSELLV